MSATPSVEAAEDPLVGRELQGRYRITRLIGQGGMGAVYAAQHMSIGNTVAIKVLHAKYAKEPGVVARFRREAQATTHIRHHNIVGMFDLGELEDGALYLVMEHLDGRDWSSDLAKEGPQPLAKVIHILTQVCDALSAAHEAGIVHRDIKPDNIYLVRRSGDPSFVKVVDFGISKVNGAASELGPSLTQTGAALGTPYYMAPEQVHGRKDIDARTDIYALGVVMYQALTGRYPFDGETYPMLVMNIVAQPVPPLAAYRPDLPLALQGVLERMVAKDREARYGSAAEVKAALRPFAHVTDDLARAVPPSAPSPIAQSEVRPIEPAPSRRTLWLVAGVLGALVLVGVGVGATIALWSASSEAPVTTTDPAPSQVLVPASSTEDPSSTEDQGVVATPTEPVTGQVAPSEPVVPSIDPVPVEPVIESADASIAPAAHKARNETRNRPRIRTTPIPPTSRRVEPIVPTPRRTERIGTNDAPILD